MRYGSEKGGVLLSSLRSVWGAKSKLELPLKIKGDPATVKISIKSFWGQEVPISENIRVGEEDLDKWITLPCEFSAPQLWSIKITIASEGTSEVLFGEIALRKKTVDKSYNGLSDSILSGTSTPGSSPLEINPIFNIVWQNQKSPKEV